MNIFEQATRAKIRYHSPNGLIGVEDLWDLPLTSLNSKRANLDDIARDLDFKLKSTTSISFVSDVSEVNEQIKLAFDVVIHVINTKIAEQKAAQEAVAIREKKQKIMSIIEQKSDMRLADSSLEELQAMLASL